MITKGEFTIHTLFFNRIMLIRGDKSGWIRHENGAKVMHIKLLPCKSSLINPSKILTLGVYYPCLYILRTQILKKLTIKRLKQLGAFV